MRNSANVLKIQETLAEEDHKRRHGEVDIGRTGARCCYGDVITQPRGSIHAIAALKPFHVTIDLCTLHVLSQRNKHWEIDRS